MLHTIHQAFSKVCIPPFIYGYTFHYMRNSSRTEHDQLLWAHRTPEVHRAHLYRSRIESDTRSSNPTNPGKCPMHDINPTRRPLISINHLNHHSTSSSLTLPRKTPL
jgi:hypothetical protein